MSESKEEKTEENKPQWASLKPAEIEKIVIDLGKQGEMPAKIGLTLRDKHGVPKGNLAGKSISKILSDAGITYKSDKEIVRDKITRLEKHISSNSHDYTAKRSVTKKLWLVKNP